ncbi:MAG: DUF5916 domain-containing protein, partial [Longimicrobiales bacterium]|nr:DUF5916 domain-containing protein [Longimicrobiales bacterium]
MSPPRAMPMSNPPKRTRRPNACVPAFVLIVAAALVPPPVLAQGGAGQGDPAADDGPDAAPFAVPRLSGPIELDGRVDEAAWAAIDPLPHVVHMPTFRGEPTAPTELRVAYDDRYLYASCRAYVRDPSHIRAPSLERDDGSFANDWCVVNLDTYDDNETAWVFGTSPAGIRTEAVFPGDGTGAPNFTWSTFWDAAASRDGDGWYAEIRVPLSSLRFQPEAGTDSVVMGVAMWRSLSRANEVHVWPAIPPRWGFPISFLKASRFRDAVFTGIEPTRPLYVTPYALGGRGRTHVLDDPGTAYTADTDRVADVGLDAKYLLASNVALDVTVNTDFAQVEADNQQVNLTRFSLFFPEKRQFFQERAAIFDFPLGGFDRLFHSRRIGIVDGQQVPIHGGVRLVGRTGGWDVGLLDMQTAATALAPSENMGVLRLRRRVFNPNSYIGGIVTTRIAEAGRGANIVYGVDAVVRVAGQDYLTVNAARSHDDPGTDPATPEPEVADPTLAEQSLLRLAWDRRGVDGFTYGAEVVRAGAAFDPDLGFLRRRDYTSAAAEAGYGWRPGEASPVLR